MLNKVCQLYFWLVRAFMFFLPDHPLFMRFRGYLYSICLSKCGRNFQISNSATLIRPDKLKIGNNVYIAGGSVIIAGGGVDIEDDVMVSYNCVISSNNHTSNNGSFRNGKLDFGNVVLCKGAWIGANSVVLKGSKLPAGSALAAASLLKSNEVIENGLYAGAPAKFKKKI